MMVLNRSKITDDEIDEDGAEPIDESSGLINVPFDPNLIKIDSPPTNLGDIIEQMEHGDIRLDADFQRKSHLWKEEKQSRLIESILLRLPLPAFYFDAQSENTWQIVDGLQRLSAIHNFVIAKTLRLTGLEFLEELKGQNYEDLSYLLKRRIKTFPITAYVIDKQTPKEVKFHIFSRINTGGLVLTPQEIRHALNQGLPADLVRALSKMPEFLSATQNTIKTERMADRDFVTRFISFYLLEKGEIKMIERGEIKNIKQYEPDLDTFMSRGMSSIRRENQDRIRSDFRRSMKLATNIFGEDAFRKRFKKEDKRKPINKALFETISVNFALLSDAQIKQLENPAVKTKFRKNMMHLMNQEKFKNAITSGTGQKEAVKIRFEEVKRVIRETLSS